MNPPLRIVAHPAGPRLYIGGRRAHHGATFGTAAIAALIARKPRAAAALALIAAHDLRDFPFRDTDNHDRRGRKC